MHRLSSPFKFGMLVGSAILEEFIDHIENDDLVRLRWLKRIRQSGFDQALSEYRESKDHKRSEMLSNQNSSHITCSMITHGVSYLTSICNKLELDS